MFNRLPAAVQISGGFLLRLAGVVQSPLFVFLFCNAIIVTLMLKSARFPAADNADGEDLVGNLVENADGRCLSRTTVPASGFTALPPAAEEEEEEVVFQDKEVVNAVASAVVECQADEIDSKNEVNFFYSSDSDSESEAENRKVFRRTRSENLQRKRGDMTKKKLQRSETEKSRKTDEGGGVGEDELSDEEFQRAVEDFIAKNLRFRREETMAVVVQGRCSVPQFELKNGIVTN
ncbi:unnamed protein product [Linum tenue]|uniref:DUF4408 domain-containing protein n=1 Tax=Linum tenue TaxID=586396 RepID=A0AAV0I3X5_9ROSI|nr:unnamed protein product [Linum tenue]